MAMDDQNAAGEPPPPPDGIGYAKGATIAALVSILINPMMLISLGAFLSGLAGIYMLAVDKELKAENPSRRLKFLGLALLGVLLSIASVAMAVLARVVL